MKVKKKKLKTLFKVSIFTVIFITAAFPFSHNTAKQVKSIYAEPPSFLRPSLHLQNEYSYLYDLREVDSAMNQLLHDWRIAGASVAIVKEGQLVYAKGFGYADREKEEKVTPNHLFRIASVSKLITAVAVMRLHEEGKIDLNAKVFGEEGILNDSVYLNIRDKKMKDITVQHLLQHEGGWSSRVPDLMFEPVKVAEAMGVPAPADTKTIIRYALGQRLPYKPGKVYSYSNLGYAILGEVVEKVTGISYEDYVRHYILDPLDIYGMQIGKNLLTERCENEVVYYDYEGSGLRLSCYGTGELVPKTYGGTNVTALGAAGGWIASPAQIMQLLVAIDGYDSKDDILSKESIKKMTTPIEPLRTGLGWMYINENDWVRTGTLAGTSALLVRRDDEISYMVVVNTSTWTGPRFTSEIKRTIERALKGVSNWPGQDLFERKVFEVASTSEIF